MTSENSAGDNISKYAVSESASKRSETHILRDTNRTVAFQSESRRRPQDVESKSCGSSVTGSREGYIAPESESKSTSRESGHETSSESTNVRDQSQSDKSNVSKGPYVGPHSIFEPRSTKELKPNDSF